MKVTLRYIVHLANYLTIRGGVVHMIHMYNTSHNICTKLHHIPFSPPPSNQQYMLEWSLALHSAIICSLSATGQIQSYWNCSNCMLIQVQYKCNLEVPLIWSNFSVQGPCGSSFFQILISQWPPLESRPKKHCMVYLTKILRQMV